MTPSQQMFKELGWLPIPKRVQYHTCVIVFKALHGQVPEYVSDLIIKSEQTKSLRSNGKDVPFPKNAFLLSIIFSKSCMQLCLNTVLNIPNIMPLSKCPISLRNG